MADLTYENALKAMKVARDKGDMEAARKMAELAKRLQDQGGPAAPADPGDTFMGHVNRGIANTAGGMVDFVNPFDDPYWQDKDFGPLSFVKGSAAEGLKQGMEATLGSGVVARSEPDNVVEGFAEGVGEGVTALIPIVKGLGMLRGSGGAVGAFADDAIATLSTYTGVAADTLLAGAAGASAEAAREMGAPDWVQNTAAIAAPLAPVAAITAANQVGKIALKTPIAGAALRGLGKMTRAVMPTTESGGRKIASERIQDLVGGPQRADDLARSIDPKDEFGMTPAQQTGDPYLMGLEQRALHENPRLRDRLAAREQRINDTGLQAFTFEGDVATARNFIGKNTDEMIASMRADVDREVMMADEALTSAGPRMSETAASEDVVTALRSSLDNWLADEATMWAAVPRTELVSTAQSRATAQTLFDSLPRAQKADMPQIARQLLLEKEGLGDQTTVSELHGLYSKLREISRSARAGTNQQRNLARVSDEIAQAILNDLGAVDPDSGVGEAINAARRFSMALHETFDQGTVGRILQRNVDGGTAMPSEAALARTVGRSGATGTAASKDIEAASRDAVEPITEYLRGRFMDSVFNASGEFTPKAAQTWMRNNRELLGRYPELRREFTRAFSTRERAAAYAARADAEIKAIETGATAKFVKGQEHKAVLSVIGADDPAKAARDVMSSARQDASGDAVAGVKSAFSHYLIDGAAGDGVLAGHKMKSVIEDREIRKALEQVFSSQEIHRMQRVANAFARRELSPEHVADTMDVPANQWLDIIVRLGAAQQGGDLASKTTGSSLVMAGAFSKKAQAMLRNITNKRARQIVYQAIEDPELMKALLTKVNLEKGVPSKLAPYVFGPASTLGDEEDG